MNHDKLIIRPANTNDAPRILKHLKTVGDESDFLTFNSAYIKITVEEEEEIITAHNSTDNQLLFIAEYEAEIIGVSNLMASQKPRLRHIGDIGISVIQKYWGNGVGGKMIEYLINWAKKGEIITKINLIVQQDNIGAYKLYEKLGFEKEGELRRALFIDGVYYDAYYMGLVL